MQCCTFHEYFSEIYTGFSFVLPACERNESLVKLAAKETPVSQRVTFMNWWLTLVFPRFPFIFPHLQLSGPALEDRPNSRSSLKG